METATATGTPVEKFWVVLTNGIYGYLFSTKRPLVGDWVDVYVLWPNDDITIERGQISRVE